MVICLISMESGKRIVHNRGARKKKRHVGLKGDEKKNKNKTEIDKTGAFAAK